MKVYNALEEFKPLRYAVVTGGIFDGVHLGHQKILNRLNEASRQMNGETAVYTFWPHPRRILAPNGASLPLLHTREERIEAMRALGIQHLLHIPFTNEFSQLTYGDFISEVLVKKIGTKKLIIGHDHRFGKNREGTFAHLSEAAPKYGFETEEIPAQDIEHIVISSSKIRKALETHQPEIASRLLGRPYSLSGTVMRGQQLGAKIGFPTANIKVSSPDKLIPACGVYAAEAWHGEKKYKGMLNIGYRPTVNGKNLSVEVHIFNFSQNIYDQSLTVRFLHFLREEKKFPTLEALAEQLKIDSQICLEKFSHETI